MKKQFPEPYKTGLCLFDPNITIPYIIKAGKGVCFWAKDGKISQFGNTCSDFIEAQELDDETITEILAEYGWVKTTEGWVKED